MKEKEKNEYNTDVSRLIDDFENLIWVAMFNDKIKLADVINAFDNAQMNIQREIKKISSLIEF